MRTSRFASAGPAAATAVLLTVAALLVPRSLEAEINVAESLDWLAASRPAIALGEVLANEGEAAPKALWLNRTTSVAVKRPLFGEPAARATFTRHVPIESPAPKPGAEFLLFFATDGTVDCAIELAAPPEAGHGVAYAKDFRILRTREEILRLVEERVARRKAPKEGAGAPPEAGPPRSLRLETPEASEAFRSLFSGSACYLIVPADAEYQPKLLEETRSKDVRTRARAAWRLAQYPGPDTVETLRALLTDDGVDVLRTLRNGKQEEERVYTVRQAAYAALKALGIAVEKPAGWSDALPASSYEW
ncbi:MAG: hypothetical protein HYZ53_21865 [Planctomycetes bacterium]|nr:hypothetical protein [Planctomycetota bacterium]